MKVRRFRIVVLLLALGAGAGWYAWRWYTTPVPPHIPLDGMPRHQAEPIEKAQERVRREPRNGAAWGELGKALAANGLHDHALECLAQAQRLDPAEPRWPYLQGSILLLQSKPLEGIPRLREALAVAKVSEERKTILHLLAESLIDEGQLDEAARHLDTVSGIAPHEPRTHFGLGLLAFAREEKGLAREHLMLVMDHPCARKRVYTLLAGLQRDDEQVAGQYRSQAAQFPPDLPWPNQFDAEVRRYLDERESPLKRYDELNAAGQRGEALNHLREVVAREPSEVVCFQLGLAHLQVGQFAESASAFRQALGFNPNRLKAQEYLGAALMEEGMRLASQPGGKAKADEMFREAIRAADKALELEGGLALAQLVRGRALAFQGRTDEAIAALRRAIQIKPDQAESHLALGELLAENGRVPEAREHLQNAVRVAKPNDPRPQEAFDKWFGKAKRP